MFSTRFWYSSATITIILAIHLVAFPARGQESHPVASLKGLKFFNSDREGAVKIMAKYMSIPYEAALRTYDTSIPAGVPMSWAVNGDMYLDGWFSGEVYVPASGGEYRFGWIIVKNLDAYAQTAMIEYTFEGDAPPVRVLIALTPFQRVSVGLHEDKRLAGDPGHPKHFSATIYFQRRGHAFVTLRPEADTDAGHHDLGTVRIE